jgi:oxygen-independent coproporphyrinogen-3 oxidase
MSEIRARYKGEVLDTLYFGGGTPSLLDLEPIIKMFNLADDAEITIETNPNFRGRGWGATRVSIGVQSFDDNILRLIGRQHTAADAVKAISMYENVSVDFIYGLPTQTLDGFVADLQKAVDLGVNHIALYGLKISEGCYFYDNPPPFTPDEDAQADMWLAAIETLRGFEHYEISNFARPGFEGRHNLNYWNNGEYYGFGVAAHGYENGGRYSNHTDLQEYFKSPRASETLITSQMQLEEEIFLGFRKGAGIDMLRINEKFGIDFRGKYKKVLEKYSQYFIPTPRGFALTKNGMLVSNAVLSEFIG